MTIGICEDFEKAHRYVIGLCERVYNDRKAREVTCSSSNGAKQPQHPALSELTEAIHLLMRDLEDGNYRTLCETNPTTFPCTNDTAHQSQELISSSRQSSASKCASDSYATASQFSRRSLILFQDSCDSETTDDEFTGSSHASPTIFNLNSFRKSPKKKSAKRSLDLGDEVVKAVSSGGEPCAATSLSDKRTLSVNSAAEESAPKQLWAEKGKRQEPEFTQTKNFQIPNSPDVVFLGSNCGEQNDEPGETFAPSQDVLFTTPNKCDLDKSVDSFNSTLPPKENSKPSLDTTAGTGSSKKKDAWFDANASTSRNGLNGKKKSSDGSKYFRQAKLPSLFKKPTVDLTTLAEYNGGSTSSQTDNNSFVVKRKSDESIGNVNKKREKVGQSMGRSFSLLDISPIRLDLGAMKQQQEGTPPSSPRAGPSAGNNGGKKPLSPVTPNDLLLMQGNQPDKSKKKEKGAVQDFTFNLMKDFDKIPSNKTPSPNFRYKEPVVRKKNERAQLRGWDCDECREYYEALESQMNEIEIQRLKDKCSRHRYKHQPKSNTPQGFWDTKLMSTQELYDQGYIQVGSPFTPKPRPPRERNSDSELENEDE